MTFDLDLPPPETLRCIPVIASDGLMLPFEEVLDWKRFSVRLYEHELPDLGAVLAGVSPEKAAELQEHGRWVYQRYFSSLAAIVDTTLQIIQGRTRGLARQQTFSRLRKEAM